MKLLVSFSLKKDIFSEKGRVLCERKSTATTFNPPNKNSKYFKGEVYFFE